MAEIEGVIQSIDETERFNCSSFSQRTDTGPPRRTLRCCSRGIGEDRARRRVEDDSRR
jgi:hypothetical protein